MTTMHLASTSHGYWDSLAMLDESDLEPNKIFPPEIQTNKKKDTVVLGRHVSRSTVDIIQHVESVMTSDDIFLDFDLEPFPVNICSNSGDISNKTIIPPSSSSFSGVATCCSLNWLKQTDDKWPTNFGKDVPIASTRMEDTLDIFINSFSHSEAKEQNIDDAYDWISTRREEDHYHHHHHDDNDEDLYSCLSRPLKRRKQTNQEGVTSLHTSSAPCVSPSVSSSSTSCSSSSCSNEETAITTTMGDEVRFRGYQADQWMERFEDLRSFKAQFGNCLVPHSYPPNQQLAQWVKRQRYQYKLKSENRHSTLTVERQKELEDLGFVWDSHKAAWYERLEALKQYRAKYGNCMVPTNFSEDKPLAVWVKCQRRQLKLFRSGRQSTMTEERFVELEQLGFEWNPRNL